MRFGYIHYAEWQIVSVLPSAKTHWLRLQDGKVQPAIIEGVGPTVVGRDESCLKNIIGLHLSQ